MIDVFFHGHGLWLVDGKYQDGTPDSIPVSNAYEACGVFCLLKRDEVLYKHTGRLKGIQILLPCTTHEDSAFLPRFRDVKNPQDYYFVIDSEYECELFVAKQSKLNLTTEKPLIETERNSLLKMVIGMAMDKYGYDPNSTKNKATGEKNHSIQSAVEKIGLAIDADTVRKFLTEAKGLLTDRGA